jgi:Saxitoxin biosynthesis operon protein SxtJ
MGKKGTNSGALHERLAATSEDVKPPSERSFGITFTVVFALIAIFPLLHGGHLRWWSVVVAALVCAITFIAPNLLREPNKLWFRFGLLLHKIVNPLVLGAMFLFAITPMALVMRLFGKKFLNLQFDPAAKSYWIERQPPGPSADSVRRQF